MKERQKYRRSRKDAKRKLGEGKEDEEVVGEVDVDKESGGVVRRRVRAF